jgi:PAS domain S-box-containing protein
VEIALRDPQAESVSLSISGEPLRDRHEQLVGAVTIIRDITARKQTEQALRQQAEQLQLQAELIELAHDAILVRDPDDRVVSWNHGAEQLYGWSAQEALGWMTHELLQTHFTGSQTAAYAHLERTGQWEGELWQSRRDGRRIIVESRQSLVRDADGQPSAILEIDRDITLRRQLEVSTRRMQATTEGRRALLQLVLDELPSSIYLVRGRDARLVLANRATTALWGASWELHQPLSEFLQQNGIRICGLDGRELAPEHWATWRALQHGEAVSQQQEIIRHADGTSLPVLVNATPLDISLMFPALEEITLGETHTTEPTALVVHQDVSALKEAERLKDEFIAIIAHELRTPLAILKGFAETLLLGQQGREQEEALDNIDLATRQLVELTEALLDVTRLQAGRLELHPEPSDLVALARRVVKRVQRTTQQHHLSLRSSQEHLVAPLDPGRMEQVLTNLLSNAIKYSPRGGPIEVAVWAEPLSAEVVLSVRDEGIGIPVQQQAGIFGRFFRAANARMLPGTGLGLYICRSLVELHGGRIWFTSLEERGSTFFLALPTEGEAATPS